MLMAVQSFPIPSHRQLDCSLLDRSSMINVCLAKQKLIAYVSPDNILLILKAPCWKKLLKHAISLKIMIKLKSYSEFKYTPSQ